MSLLIRAIISGFGMKLGQDIYRVLNDKLGVFPDDDKSSSDDDDDDDDDLDDSLPFTSLAF